MVARTRGTACQRRRYDLVGYFQFRDYRISGRDYWRCLDTWWTEQYGGRTRKCLPWRHGGRFGQSSKYSIDDHSPRGFSSTALELCTNQRIQFLDRPIRTERRMVPLHARNRSSVISSIAVSTLFQVFPLA